MHGSVHHTAITCHFSVSEAPTSPVRPTYVCADRFGPCRCLPTSCTWREFHVTLQHSSPGGRRGAWRHRGQSLLLFAVGRHCLRHYVFILLSPCWASKTADTVPHRAPPMECWPADHPSRRLLLTASRYTVVLGRRLQLQWIALMSVLRLMNKCQEAAIEQLLRLL